MSNVIVKPLSGGRSARRAALKRDARKFEVSYGTLLKTPEATLAIYAQEPLPDYFTWFWAHKPKGNTVLVASHHDQFIIMLCSDAQVHLCAMKSAEQVRAILESQNTGHVLFIHAAETETDSQLASVANRKKWRVHYPQIDKLSSFRPIRALAPAPLIALSIPLVLCLVTLKLVSTPVTDVVAEETANPFDELEFQLTATPGRLTPLLRLDYNYLYLLETVPGWALVQVEYSTQGVHYAVENEQGSYQELMTFAENLNLGIRFSSGTALLTKPINLPVVFATLDVEKLTTQKKLVATLHDRIQTWMPDAQLTVQQEQRTDLWVSQRAMIQFSGLFPADLLTLAGLFEGLALKFEHGKYRINNGQLTGNILVTLYGATT